MVKLATLDISATDVTGQKHVEVRGVDVNLTVGELLDGLLPRMRLQHVDREGQQVLYAARLDRESRHLNRSEIVGEALRSADHLVMHPRILAGRPRR